MLIKPNSGTATTWKAKTLLPTSTSSGNGVSNLECSTSSGSTPSPKPIFHSFRIYWPASFVYCNLPSMDILNTGFGFWSGNLRRALSCLFSSLTESFCLFMINPLPCMIHFNQARLDSISKWDIRPFSKKHLVGCFEVHTF